MNETCIQYTFRLPAGNDRDILLAKLQAHGFDGFQETATELIGYITADYELPESFCNYPFLKQVIEAKNWNEEWEKNFEPVQVEDLVSIRANFHQPVKDVQHEIIINPKMSFGTGHHATTYLMLQQMQLLNFKGKQVLDFGTGTGILSVMAEKLGASLITAVDNDEWSISNALENININHCKNIQVIQDHRLDLLAAYDIILANINKNVIIEHLQSLSVALKKNGYLVLSGFLATDKKEIYQTLTSLGFNYMETTERNSWICILSGTKTIKRVKIN